MKPLKEGSMAVWNWRGSGHFSLNEAPAFNWWPLSDGRTFIATSFVLGFENIIELPEAPCTFSYKNSRLDLHNFISRNRRKNWSGELGLGLDKAVFSGGGWGAVSSSGQKARPAFRELRAPLSLSCGQNFKTNTINIFICLFCTYCFFTAWHWESAASDRFFRRSPWYLWF